VADVTKPAAGWHPDPLGRHQQRYWDGSSWTVHVSDGGVTTVDHTWSGLPTGQAAGDRPLGGLSTALTVLLFLCGVAATATSFALFNRASLLDDLPAHSLTELQDADDVVVGVGVSLIVLFVVTGIVWVIWQHRHAKNARLLGQREGLGPGWAIGGWFVPIGNFFLPQMQLAQAAKVSDSDSSTGGRVPPVLVVWWVLFGVLGLAGRAFENGGEELTELSDVDQFRSEDQTAAVLMLLVVAAAVTATLMVRSLTAKQRRALTERGVVR
jgi:hypothetical protein